MKIIGVAGASASGKTEFCEIIRTTVKEKTVAIIPLDAFYKGVPDSVDPENYDFDHPDAFNVQLLIQLLQKLKKGENVEIPIYDYITHKPKNETLPIPNVDVVIVEGIFTLHWEELRKLMDFKIFVLTDLDLCLVRRLLRDTQKRGRTYQQVIEQYQKYVRGAYHKYVKQTEQYANIIIPNNEDTHNFQIGINSMLVNIEYS